MQNSLLSLDAVRLSTNLFCIASGLKSPRFHDSESASDFFVTYASMSFGCYTSLGSLDSVSLYKPRSTMKNAHGGMLTSFAA